MRILLELTKGELSTTEIQKHLNIGWKTVITQLYTARQLGLVDYSEDNYADEGEGAKKWKRKTWALTQDPVVTYLREQHQSIRDQLVKIYA